MTRAIGLCLLLTGCAADVPRQLEQLDALARLHRAENVLAVVAADYERVSAAKVAAEAELVEARDNLEGVFGR